MDWFHSPSSLFCRISTAWVITGELSVFFVGSWVWVENARGREAWFGGLRGLSRRRRRM